MENLQISYLLKSYDLQELKVKFINCLIIIIFDD